MKNKRNHPEFLFQIQAAVLLLPRLCYALPVYRFIPITRTFLIIVACAGSLMWPATSYAQQVCRNINVGYSYYPPFSYQDANGLVKGASVEVAKRAFNQMKVDVTLVQMPWARLLREAQDGSIDFIAAAYRTPDRLAWATYSDAPIGYERIVVIHDSHPRFDEPTLNDLRRQKGLLRRGDSHGPEVDQAIAKNILTVDEIPEIEVGLRMLDAGRADYLLTSDAVARDMLRQHLYPDLSFSRVKVAGEALYALFSQQSPCVALAEQFNQTIRNLHRQDLMPTLLVQYLKSVGSPLVVELASQSPTQDLGN
ncbi:ABC transporter substrate-binding protein [Thalassospira sp. MCCC 1A01428]|uniref:substrate-binding periplasmic protein n=1 Tax=Thalassospira sp. MCCC 1A01428 TaxID=1470575 RepID=UPI000A1E4949|nr:transporter substrate-binding domain-containing protein [Thalassospira sp. MCCC 1A01428]OSQ42735.1 hypothetical protein THS27_13355 [Thalassospira sp. MCCC 1A01428]